MRYLFIVALLAAPNLAMSAGTVSKDKKHVLVELGTKDMKDKDQCAAGKGKVVIVNGVAYCKSVISHNSSRSNVSQ